MQDDIVKRLMWTGLLTAMGAAASFLVDRSARVIWKRVFHEEPPA
jgi:hypothetical protein